MGAGRPQRMPRLAPEDIEACQAALQSAVTAAIHSDARDQTDACLVGAHMLGLWPADLGDVEPTAEAIERVREVAYVASAALNTAASKALATDELVKFVGSAILGSSRSLSFCELGWGATQFSTLAAVLPGCVVLEELTIAGMSMSDADAAAVVAALPSTVKSLSLSCPGLRRCPDLASLPMLQVLSLGGCPELEAAPDVSSLSFLERLDLFQCGALTGPPDVGALASLQILNLAGCSALTALPDVSGVSALRALVKPAHLE